MVKSIFTIIVSEKAEERSMSTDSSFIWLSKISVTLQITNTPNFFGSFVVAVRSTFSESSPSASL